MNDFIKKWSPVLRIRILKIRFRPSVKKKKTDSFQLFPPVRTMRIQGGGNSDPEHLICQLIKYNIASISFLEESEAPEGGGGVHLVAKAGEHHQRGAYCHNI